MKKINSYPSFGELKVMRRKKETHNGKKKKKRNLMFHIGWHIYGRGNKCMKWRRK